MKKVGFFRSIQLKFIIIYILLLIIAVQVIGSYVSRALEEELLTNFKESINDRVELFSYNLEQVFNQERTDDPEERTLQEDVQGIVFDIERGRSTNIQVLNSQGRILGTNDYKNQHNIGKKSTDPEIQRAIKFGAPDDNIVFNSRTGQRILIRVEPIYSAEENVVGVIYLEASLEGVYTQQAEINEIFLKGSMIAIIVRSEEHTSELQSRGNLVCRLQLEKNNNQSICMYV